MENEGQRKILFLLTNDYYNSVLINCGNGNLFHAIMNKQTCLRKLDLIKLSIIVMLHKREILG